MHPQPVQQPEMPRQDERQEPQLSPPPPPLEQVPFALQVVPDGHVPQVPPQPLDPQVRPVHLGWHPLQPPEQTDRAAGQEVGVSAWSQEANEKLVQE